MEDDVNWGEELRSDSLEIVIPSSEDKTGLHRSRKRKAVDRNDCLNRHKEDLLCKIENAREIASVANSDELKGRLLSLATLDLLLLDKKSTCFSASKEFLVASLENFRRKGFYCIEDRSNGIKSSVSLDDLIRTVLEEDRIGTKNQILTLLMSYLNVLGIPTRIAVATYALSLSEASDSGANSATSCMWLEVCLDSYNDDVFEWTHLDILVPKSHCRSKVLRSKQNNLAVQPVSMGPLENESKEEPVSDVVRRNIEYFDSLIAQESQITGKVAFSSQQKAEIRGPRGNIVEDPCSKDESTVLVKEILLQFVFNRPDTIEGLLSGGRSLAYVFAIDVYLRGYDVTEEYSGDWSRTCKKRLQDESSRRWLTEVLQPQELSSFDRDIHLPERGLFDTEMSAISPQRYERGGKISKSSYNASATMHTRQRENSSPVSSTAGFSPLPKHVQDFQHHPTYVLERFLKPHQFVADFSSFDASSKDTLSPYQKPESLPCCLFNGERVYLKSQITSLRTSSQWRYLGRNVITGSIPVRIIPAIEADNSKELRYFGEWQTSELELAKVTQGVIPINRYGNVEVWNLDEKYVPEGSVLFPGTVALKLAKKLCLHHAPALVGFQDHPTKINCKLPKIGGVVILQEDRNILADALEAKEEAKRQILAKQREDRVYTHWKCIIQKALIEKRLSDTYG